MWEPVTWDDVTAAIGTLSEAPDLDFKRERLRHRRRRAGPCERDHEDSPRRRARESPASRQHDNRAGPARRHHRPARESRRRSRRTLRPSEHHRPLDRGDRERRQRAGPLSRDPALLEGARQELLPMCEGRAGCFAASGPPRDRRRRPGSPRRKRCREGRRARRRRSAHRGRRVIVRESGGEARGDELAGIAVVSSRNATLGPAGRRQIVEAVEASMLQKRRRGTTGLASSRSVCSHPTRPASRAHARHALRLLDAGRSCPSP